MRDPNLAKLPTVIDRHIGSRLRWRRRKLALTQDELGKMMNLSFQQVQKYEKGANRISSGRLFEFAATLGVSVEYFFDGLETKYAALQSGDRSSVSSITASEFPVIDNAAIKLVEAFDTIPDKKLRKTILQLAQQMKVSLAAKQPANDK